MTLLAGQAFPPVVDDITARRVVMGPGATGDYFPGHWDPSYALAQGQPAIYANSLHVFGLLDRAATEWLGPTSFLVRRTVRLELSMYAGDTATVNGTVAAVQPDGVVELAMTITNQDGGTICSATLALRRS